MSRFIDANALKSAIQQYHNSLKPRYISKLVDAEIADILDIIDEQPTVDAMPLRCHIGDIVRVVGTKCLSGLYEEECERNIALGKCECSLNDEHTIFLRIVEASLFCSIHELHDPGHFRWGETVFKTKEEAEAALAKLVGGADNA